MDEASIKRAYIFVGNLELYGVFEVGSLLGMLVSSYGPPWAHHGDTG